MAVRKTRKAVAAKAEPEMKSAQELYQFLYKACNILRKKVEHESFKDYLTPLLYYKRISDVWDEEYRTALEESGGDEEYARLPEQHRFVIPDGCHWADVRERTENVGTAIVEALRLIEQANPETLYGVLSAFSTENFTDKNKLPDELLINLIEHLSQKRLGNGDYSADLMGDAYEILLKKFADESKAKAGEFYTPRPVVRLLVRILDPQPGDFVLDVCSAPGGKTTHLSQLMKNKGRIIAGDLYPARLEKVAENARRLGITIIETAAGDARCIGERYLRQADRVLVDAPCSGLGVLRRRPDARWRVTADDMKGLPPLQLEILESAAQCVKQGGVLVYSTCTMEPAENAGVVEKFLAANKDFTLVETGQYLPEQKRSSRKRCSNCDRCISKYAAYV